MQRGSLAGSLSVPCYPARAGRRVASRARAGGLGPVHPISSVALAGKGAGCKAPVRSKAEALQARATPQTAPLPANPKGRSATAGHSALRSLRVRMHTRRHAP
ncbi:hypothetical protein VHAB30_19030 [Variovorax boronicumulans]|nr:hypothetical protein VHAB30_19030 [Variovorax boronicumulans]